MMLNHMDSISIEKGRKKNKKTLLRERNRRASLMRKCIKNRIIQNHELGGRLSNSELKESSTGNVNVKYRRNKRLGMKKEDVNECVTREITINDNFEREDSSQVNEIHENHSLIAERLNSAGQILDSISVTLENIQFLFMGNNYRKLGKEEMLNNEKRVLRSEKRKVQNDIIGLKEEILKVKKLFEDAKNENEIIKRNVEKLMKKNSYLRASEKYKTELCEDLHDKIAALESNKTVKYYWSQS
uniref:BZIP domain-containing protein n=1 Tax=Strongyloides venezuelensis TaxID=75913 RepID=A0A0K0F0E4_STRVS